MIKFYYDKSDLIMTNLSIMIYCPYHNYQYLLCKWAMLATSWHQMTL